MRNLVARFFLVLLVITLISSCKLSTFDLLVETSISWQRPFERENGELLMPGELAGYIVEYRAAHELEYHVYATLSADDLELPISLMPGAYDFRIAAFDTDGLYSRFTPPKRLILNPER